MAIKVGGTTVIDDSRQLTNITSVDATTVAALGTAGVGAGGGVIELPAGETISAGDFVEVQSSGSAFKVKESTVPLSVATQGSAAWLKTTGSGGKTARPHVVSASSTFDPVITFIEHNQRPNWNLHLVSENTPIASPSSSQYFGGYDTNGNNTSVYDTYNNVVVGIWVVYENDSTAWGSSAVCTPNSEGTSISIGSETKWLNGYRSDHLDAVYGAGGVFFITYQSDNGGSYVIAGSVSGTSISYGSPIQWDSDKRQSYAFYDSTNSQLGIVTDTGKAYFFSHSGTTLTAKSYNSSNEWNGGFGVNPKGAIYNPDTGKVIISYRRNTGAYVRAGSVTNNSISWGTAQQLDSNGSFTNDSQFALLSDGRVAVIIASGGAGYAKLYLLSLSGTAITVPNDLQLSVSEDGSGLVEHPDNDILYHGAREQSASRLIGLNFQTVTTNAENRIGIASENIASGSTGDVLVAGNKYSGYSGLTPGSAYFIADDGTISTSGVASRRVGRAVSATTLLIEG
jgi:hypothetical protein